MIKCPHHGNVEAYVSGYPPFERLCCPVTGCNHWTYFKKKLIIRGKENADVEEICHIARVEGAKALHTKRNKIKVVNVTKTPDGVMVDVECVGVTQGKT